MQTNQADARPKQPKSILKRSTDHQSQTFTKFKRNASTISKSATFDEQNLVETMHPINKDYGHQQIDEPKTPFVRSSQSHANSTPVDPQALSDKLLQLQIEQQRTTTDSPSFEEKRRQHYTEAQCLKDQKKSPEKADDDVD